MSFTPTLFIGIGTKSHFYTLRETHLVYIPGEGPMGNAVVNGVYQGTTKVSSHHLYNLSQNPEVAIEKAREAAVQMGLPLENITVERLGAQLREIQRATADEMAERHAREERAQREYEERRAMWDAQDREVLAAGFMPMTRYTGAPLEKVDIGFVHWVISKRDEFEESSLIRAIADKYIADYPEMMPRYVNPTATYGEPKEKIEVNVHVIRQAGYHSDFGYINVITMVMDDGTCLVAKGRFKAEPGQALRIKATVKEHSEYRGQMQTIINRVKVVE